VRRRRRRTPHLFLDLALPLAGEGDRNALEKRVQGRGKAAAKAPHARADTEGQAVGAADAEGQAVGAADAEGQAVAGHPTARGDDRDKVQNSRMNENVHALRYI
jgi:hypothetical protein